MQNADLQALTRIVVLCPNPQIILSCLSPIVAEMQKTSFPINTFRKQIPLRKKEDQKRPSTLVEFESRSNQIAVDFGNKVPFPKLIRSKLPFESNSTLKMLVNSAFENPLFMGGLCKCGKVFGLKSYTLFF